MSFIKLYYREHRRHIHHKLKLICIDVF